MIYVVFALILVMILWLCKKNDEVYVYVGLLLAAVLFKNYEREVCVFLVLLFIMMLLREYEEKDSVLRSLWLKIKKKF